MPPKPLLKSKVLIVDDTAINIDTLVATLGSIYDVRIAISGETALNLILNNNFIPDLILLDIMMPEMDGYEVCRHLKANIATQHIPIIFLTALNSVDSEEKGLALGASDYITKPFSPAIVRRRVKIQLELKQHREQLQSLIDDKTFKLQKSKQELISNEAYLQTILRSAPVGIGLIVDTKLQWVNQKMGHLVGYTKEELSGQLNRIIYCDDEEYDRIWGEESVFNDTHEAVFTETKLNTRDNRIIDAFLSFTPLDNKNLKVGTLFTVLDVTERNKLQKEQDRSNRLASIGVLASGIAHEINNPNGSILCNSAILENVFKDLIKVLKVSADEHKQHTFGGLSYRDLTTDIPIMIRDTNTAARRIKHIVSELRDFSRPDSNKEAVPVNLNDVITSSIHLVENEINKGTDNFHIKLDPDLPLIEGVYTSLEQVIINLLINAVQALDCKSQVISVYSKYNKERSKVCIEIKDDGCGIPPEIIETIVEPFVTTKLEQGGTGLGLSVSARIVKAHNGTLNFTSVPKFGTKAQIEFPLFKG